MPHPFLQGSVAEGVGSCKSKVLSDSAVTLARHYPDIIANEIISRMLKTLIYTRDHPVTTLVQHFLWVELAVLSQFLLTLSFNNCLNGNVNSGCVCGCGLKHVCIFWNIIMNFVMLLYI